MTLSKLPPVVVVNRRTGSATAAPFFVAGGIVAALVLSVGLFVVLQMNLGGGPRTPPNKTPALAKARPNNKPFEPVRKTFPFGPVTDDWIAYVRTLPPEEQGKWVFMKLADLNEGFEANNASNTLDVKDGKVRALATTAPVAHTPVTDISPLRALKDLQSLTCWAVYRPDIGSRLLVALADISSLKGLPLKELSLQSHRVEDLSPLADVQLESLNLSFNPVRELCPLAKMISLKNVELKCTLVDDVGPLRGLKLESLNLTGTAVKDLAPLADMQLKKLWLTGTDVVDLSPLDLSALERLDITSCPITDLTPLAQAKKLKVLTMHGVPFRTLEPLKNVPLEAIGFAYDPKHADTLAALSVQTINRQPAAEFWKIIRPDPEQDKWAARVAGLPVEEQIKEVAERLRHLNPDCTVKPDIKQENGSIVEISITGRRPKDLRFLTPLKALRSLSLADPDCYHIANLEPLRGLPLRRLYIHYSIVQDFSPLAGMPLAEFSAGVTAAEDWTPVRSLTHLSSFEIGHPMVTRVEPFADLPLKRLRLHGSNPRGLHALQNLKQLTEINFYYDDFRHRDALKAMTGLKLINGKKSDDFWKWRAEQQVEFVQRELVRLNPTYSGKVKPTIMDGVVTEVECFGDIKDTTPLRGLPDLRSLHLGRGKWLTPIDLTALIGMKLKTLSVHGAELTDWSVVRHFPLEELQAHNDSIASLEPLRGLKLKVLKVTYSKVDDLEPLRGMPLKVLDIGATQVSDLSPLVDMKLNSVAVSSSKVSDISVLKGMPLEYFRCGSTTVDLSPLRGAPLKVLYLNQHPGLKDWSPLMSMPLEEYTGPVQTPSALSFLRSCRKTLQTINSLPAEEFWQELDQNNEPTAK